MLLKDRFGLILLYLTTTKADFCFDSGECKIINPDSCCLYIEKEFSDFVTEISQNCREEAYYSYYFNSANYDPNE